MAGDSPFAAMFVPDAIRDAVSERAWIAAMLDFEAALAAAEADLGLIPAGAAEAIAAACRPERFDPGTIANAARATANPAAPLVAALTDAVEGDAAGHVHRGATSQDAMDTASALVARGALRLIDAELAGVAAACAALAARHRATQMPARTLLQQALPTTFGLKAAGWLDAVVDARRRLRQVPLAVELGGAAGTMASLGSDGLKVLERIAARLELAEPPLPWHAARMRVAELGTTLALAAGALEKIARDVTLLAQTEVGEVTEPAGPGRGGSSTLPHKRNPVGSVLAIACALRVRGEAAILLEAMPAEHERAAGAWQAEWQALSAALAYTGGAAAAMREVLEGLEVRPQRMKENLEMTGGLVLAEAISSALSERLGRHEGHALMEAAARRAADADRPLREELLGDGRARWSAERERARRAARPGQLPRLRRGAGRPRAGALRGGAMNDDVRDRGMKARREVLGDAHVDAASGGASPLTADFQDLITRYAWGEIWARPGLDRRTRSAITIGMLVARGQYDELALHLRAALRNGLTGEEIKEVLLQSAIYCGVPAANSAFAVAQRVLDEQG